MRKLNQLGAIIILFVSKTAIANTEENPYQDGNTLGGLFTRLADLLAASFATFNQGLLTLGIISVISGLLMIANANKLQISPRLGMVICIIGFAFCSPKGCSSMSSQTI
nr:hypothetical protein [Vibrio anguillarum]